MLARTARVGRSEIVCFRNGGFPLIDPAPEKPPVLRGGSSSAPKFKIRRILDERLLAAAIIAAIIQIPTMLCREARFGLYDRFKPEVWYQPSITP